jgi:hypothetical protein
MFILGILGLLQVWFLPGLFLISFSRKIELPDLILLSVPLSISINTLIIFFLIILKAYTQEFLLLIIFFEIIFIIYNFKKNKILLPYFFENFFQLKNKFNIKINFLDLIIYFLSGILAFFAFNTIGEAIHVGDSLRSYNEWSLEWFNNKIPFTYSYPPGLPIIMSIVYKAINNNDLETFTRAIFTIYPIWAVFAAYRISQILPKYSLHIKISLIISLLIFFKLFRHFLIYIGYTEPILFSISICLILIIILIYKFYNSYNFYEYLIFGLTISASLILKQTGIFISLIFPFFFLFFFYKKNTKKKLFYNFLIISSPVLMMLLWYAFIFYKIYFLEIGTGYTEYIISLNKGSAYQKLYSIFGILTIPSIILVFFGLINRLSLNIFIIITLPYFIFYYLYFGFDNRHFAIIIPFIALNISLGMFEFFKKIKYDLPNYFCSSILTIFFMLLLIFVNFLRGEERLLNDSYAAKIRRGDLRLNTLLYNYTQNDNFKIISVPNYLDLNYLPTLGRRVIPITDCKNLINFIDENKEVKFYLILNHEFCKDYLNNFVIKNYYIKLFYFQQYSFYFYNKPEKQNN